MEPPTPSVDAGNFPSDAKKRHTVLVPASRVSSGRSFTTQTIQEEDEGEEKGSEKQTYLRSKLWWLGLLLMAVGESANFISYGLAAASVVAPLGTVGKPPFSLNIPVSLSLITTGHYSLDCKLFYIPIHARREVPLSRRSRGSPSVSRCSDRGLISQTARS